DAPAIRGDPGGGPEPAVGVGGELSLPAAQISADPGGVGRPALDDLNEHGRLSLSAMPLSSSPSLPVGSFYILLIRRYRVMFGTTLPAMISASHTVSRM